MARALFIRPIDVFKNTLIQADLDEDKLLPFIEGFQDTQLQDFLGENFSVRLDTLVFNAKQSPVVSPNINETAFAAYKSFITDHLRRIVEQGTASLYLSYGQFTVSNKGVFVHAATNATPATDAQVMDLINKIDSRKEFYMERTLDFLCNNTGLFPEYIQTGTSDLPPSYETYDYGWTSA